MEQDRKEKASEHACQTLYAIVKGFSSILSFASINDEIDLWKLNKILAEEGRLVLPKIQKNELCLYRVADCENLKLHPFGILEPLDTDSVLTDLSSIDIAFIPGLGFDPFTKMRLGYGKGYYDRLLGEMDHAQTYGIAFREQSLINLPYDSYDIPLKHLLFF